VSPRALLHLLRSPIGRSGHGDDARRCPHSGVKRTLTERASMSAFDPKRTSRDLRRQSVSGPFCSKPRDRPGILIYLKSKRFSTPSLSRRVLRRLGHQRYLPTLRGIVGLGAFDTPYKWTETNPLVLWRHSEWHGDLLAGPHHRQRRHPQPVRACDRHSADGFWR